MTTLITGANGFLGRHIVETLVRDYPEDLFISVQRRSSKPDSFRKDNWVVDLTNHHVVKAMFDSPSLQPIERIIHCAGNPIVRVDENDPSGHIDDNIMTTNNLLHYAPAGCHFIFMSSITVYGDYKPSIEYPFTEDHPLRPTSIYAASKISCEYLLSVYAKLKGIKSCIVRPSAIVGKYSTHGVVYDFVRKLLSEDKCLDVLGNYPGSEKPYTHAQDFADFISLCVKTNAVGNFNLSRDDTLTTDQIAAIVTEAVGINKDIRWGGGNWVGDNPVIKASSNRAKMLGWKPKYTSAEAVSVGAKEIYARLTAN